MSRRKQKSVVLAIQEWLDGYSASSNTYRTYYREFKRLQTWMLSKNLDFIHVTSDQISEYFELFAAGLLSQEPSVPGSTQYRSRRSLEQCRGILSRLFKLLQSSGFRVDNPIHEARLPDLSVENRGISPDANIESWSELRKLFAEQPEPVFGDRENSVRAFAIAELSYWVSMQRSELAAGVMADFQCADSEWYIAIRRFGKGRVNRVFVPKPAMEALRRYRVSRGLSSFPSQFETDVPIIARLHTESPVDPWTIANAIRIVTKRTGIGAPEKNRTPHLSSRTLRTYFLYSCLSNKLSAVDLAKHVRSDFAVQTMANYPILPTFVVELTKLSGE